MFQIGQHVFIPSRMIGENKPGGVANIISVTGFAGASPLLPGVWYDAKYVVDNRVEKSISESLITAWSHERQPRLAAAAAASLITASASSSFNRPAAPAGYDINIAAAAAKLRVSEKKIRELELVVEKQQTELQVVTSREKQQRSEVTALRSEIKEAQADSKALIAENTTLIAENAAVRYHAERALVD
jgi:hypothetical protein